jgi:hypothetical protein
MSLRPVADEANVGMTRETISGVIIVYRMMGTDRTGQTELSNFEVLS